MPTGNVSVLMDRPHLIPLTYHFNAEEDAIDHWGHRFRQFEEVA